MLKGRFTLEGIGKKLPKRALTNADLEAIIDTTEEWIVTRTGMKTRFISGPDEPCTVLAEGACREALKDAGRPVEDVTHVYLHTLTGDAILPAAACTLIDRLGINGRPACDLNAACTGFLYAMEVALGTLALRPESVALISSADILSSRVNWEDRATCVLFGDAACAAVISTNEPKPGQAVIEDVVLHSDGSLGQYLTIKGGGSANPLKLGDTVGPNFFIEMTGQELFKHAVRSMTSVSDEILQKNDLKPEDVDLIIPHQANLRIIDAVTKRLKAGPEKVMITVDRYGNTSGASMGLAMVDAKAEERIKPGTRVLLTGFGGGFTWGSALLKFV